MSRLNLKEIEEYLQRYQTVAPDINKAFGPIRAARRTYSRGPDAEKWRDSFVARLQAFPYPYDGNRGDLKTYVYLEKLGLLDEILRGQAFLDIRVWLTIQEELLREEDLKAKGKAASGHDSAYHRDMALALVRHLTLVRHLVEKHKVDPGWTDRYFRTAELQLYWELNNIPGVQLTSPYLREYHRTRIQEDTRVSIYEAILGCLERRRIKRGAKSLAQQLTAIACASSDCLETHELCPSPESIKKLVQSRSNRALGKPTSVNHL